MIFNHSFTPLEILSNYRNGKLKILDWMNWIPVQFSSYCNSKGVQKMGTPTSGTHNESLRWRPNAGERTSQTIPVVEDGVVQDPQPFILRFLTFWVFTSHYSCLGCLGSKFVKNKSKLFLWGFWDPEISIQNWKIRVSWLFLS